VRKAIGILLMATLMAICFTATAAPALAGVSTTYIKSDIALGHTQTMNHAGQEVIASASISKPGVATAYINNLHLGHPAAMTQNMALSVRSLGATPFRICS